VPWVEELDRAAGASLRLLLQISLPAAEAGRSALLLTLLKRAPGLTPLPLFKSRVLVVQTEVAAGEPPLDGTAECGASAPAVRIAGALAAAGCGGVGEDSCAHGESRPPHRSIGQSPPGAEAGAPPPPGELELLIRTRRSCGRRRAPSPCVIPLDGADPPKSSAQPVSGFRDPAGLRSRHARRTGRGVRGC
jgi:hypothetical protein